MDLNQLLDSARQLRSRAEALRNQIASENPVDLEAAATALEAAVEQLRRQSQSLAAANLSSERFISNLSHELRTPLTPALLIVSALQEDPGIPNEARADLAMVREQIDLEVRLVDDLLDITKISRGKLKLSLQVISVHAMIEEVIASARRTFGQAPAVQADLVAARHWVNTDPARLRQILGNLLQNAMKFTPSSGQVSICTADTADGVAIDVIDTGRGFDPQSLPRLYEAFEQEPTLARTYGGLGLGLSIARGLASLHGGTLIGQSEGPGKGSRFRVTLPAVAPPRASAESSPAEVAAPDSVPGRRILLVEDHTQSLALTARLLKSHGYNVSTAGGYVAALRLLQTKPFDLLLCDIELPDGNGWDLMRIARQGGNVKGLALSGYGSEEDIRKSRQAGFEKHLLKPVTVQLLTQEIQNVFASPTAG